MGGSGFWGLYGLSPGRIKHLLPQIISIEFTIERLPGGIGLVALGLAFRVDQHLL